jgi:hypothetical protein
MEIACLRIRLVRARIVSADRSDTTSRRKVPLAEDGTPGLCTKLAFL